MGPLRIVIYILVVLVLIYILYALWLWLKGKSDVQDMVIYSSQTDGLPARTTGAGKIYSGTQVPMIYPGGEYSISTWIYVTNWGAGGSTGKNKPFLVLSNGPTQATLIMYLGQFINKLGIRVSDSSDTLNHIPMTTVSSTDFINGSTKYSDTDGMPACDIESIDIQRWVNITVVMMGKTVDVYMDGKLSRSSILPGLFHADTTNVPTLTLGSPNGFGGLIGMTRAANIAYTPDRIYTNYQEGPFAGFSWDSLNPSQYILTLTRNNSIIFSASST
jgi:hypothetical protein